jgi:hypothetical protein
MTSNHVLCIEQVNSPRVFVGADLYQHEVLRNQLYLLVANKLYITAAAFHNIFCAHRFLAMAPIVYLITGCSSGFGASYVDHILDRGDKVIATARNSSRIEKLKDKGAEILELDVTWPQDKIDPAIKEAIEFYGHIDVLINNAGYVVAGFLEETTSVAHDHCYDILITPF